MNETIQNNLTIAGFAIGVLLLIVLISLIAIFAVRRKKKIEAVQLREIIENNPIDQENRKRLQIYSIDPYEQDELGNNQLHYAAEHNYVSSGLFLINKVNLNLQHQNINALEKIRLLNEYINSKNSSNDSPLHIAVKKQNFKFVEMLVRNNKDLDLDIKNTNGETPLHLAVRSMDRKIVDLLINHGADFDVIDNNGNTPKTLAQEFKFNLFAENNTKKQNNKTIKSITKLREKKTKEKISEPVSKL